MREHMCTEELHAVLNYFDDWELEMTLYFSLFSTAKASKKLTLLYLANDVLQNSKKKGSEFNAEFKTVLPAVFKHCAQ